MSPRGGDRTGPPSWHSREPATECEGCCTHLPGMGLWCPGEMSVVGGIFEPAEGLPDSTSSDFGAPIPVSADARPPLAPPGSPTWTGRVSGSPYVALGASIINGAIGYGFSSIVTPIALFWFSNKLLNPAVVSVELLVNVALLFRERAYIPATKSRAMPVVTTLLPGVLLGTLGLSYLAVNDVKFAVYAVLLPMVVVQLFRIWRSKRWNRSMQNGLKLKAYEVQKNYLKAVPKGDA